MQPVIQQIIQENNSILTESVLGDYVKKTCEKYPKACKVAKVASTVAGAMLLVKGAMNYQKVQTMECYNSKPMFKSRYDSQSTVVKSRTVIYDKLKSELMHQKEQIKNARLTSNERQEKLNELKQLEEKIHNAKIAIDKEKDKLNVIINSIRDCTNSEKLKQMGESTMSIHEKSITQKLADKCKKNPKICLLLKQGGNTLVTAGLTYGAIRGGMYLAKEKAREEIKKVDEYRKGIITKADLEREGIKIPKEYEIEFDLQHKINSGVNSLKNKFK